MRTNLQEAMTAGVLVEFQDERGNTVGREVFTGWQGRPLPAVGDTLCCQVRLIDTGRDEKLSGYVLARHFDVQDDEGRPCVWAHVVAQVAADGESPRRTGATRVRFSEN